MLDHAVDHHIGNTVDGCQRRFQFMRDIGCEFTAILLLQGAFLLCTKDIIHSVFGKLILTVDAVKQW